MNNYAKRIHQQEQNKKNATSTLVVAFGNKFCGELSLSKTDCCFYIHNTDYEVIDSVRLDDLTGNKLQKLYDAYLYLPKEKLIDDEITEALSKIETYLHANYKLEKNCLKIYGAHTEMSKTMLSHIISFI